MSADGAAAGLRWPCAAACLAALAGCATFSDTIQSTERSLAQQQPKAALAEYEKLKPNAADRVLYLMNTGMLQRMCGDYDASTRTLEATKRQIEDLRALSLREQALSVTVNDATKSFIGEDFERVMVNNYLALNYLERGQLDAARVEALQVDILLREKQQRTSKDNPYQEDAFARYLTGIIYEDEGEWSDAMIAYRKAYEAYTRQLKSFGVAMPETLKHDLIRLADRMGIADEAKRYREEFKIDQTLSEADLLERGEIIFVVNAGLAPLKRERAVTAPNLATGRIVRVAVPQYRPRAHPFAYARLSADSATASTSRVENVEAIAMKTLDSEIAGITARAIARAIAKDTIAGAASAAGSNNNSSGAAGAALIGLAVNLAGVLTERADTRSWFTLPGDIHLARLVLPPGDYKLKIDLHATDERVLESKEVKISLRKGEKKYLSQHWIPTNLEVRP
ncbi:MAG TPA: hypothetical protein VFK92_11505 [Burkholderiales bacterium]|nr:hypothetical protein [Burkholderiales bacterium]